VQKLPIHRLEVPIMLKKKSLNSVGLLSAFFDLKNENGTST